MRCTKKNMLILFFSYLILVMSYGDPVRVIMIVFCISSISFNYMPFLKTNIFTFQDTSKEKQMEEVFFAHI